MNTNQITDRLFDNFKQTLIVVAIYSACTGVIIGYVIGKVFG